MCCLFDHMDCWWMYFAGIFEGGVGVLIYGSISLVLWYGGKLVYQKEVTPGILTGKAVDMVPVDFRVQFQGFSYKSEFWA